MIQSNILQIGLQEGLSFSHSRIVVFRQDFHALSHCKSLQKIEKVELGPSTRFGERTYKAAPSFSEKPLPTPKKMNGHALRKAVFEVKPCMDLRQVRRGRKVFQIPRVIPAIKRKLFGVRRLLSVCTSTNRQSLPTPAKSFDPVSRNKGKITEKTNESLLSLRLTSPKQPFLSQNTKTNTNTFSSNKQESLSEKSSLISILESPGSYTRTTLMRHHQKASFLSLSSCLSSEIKACSRSRSRSIENKKRIYKTASANRGCIRMAWWL